VSRQEQTSSIDRPGAEPESAGLRSFALRPIALLRGYRRDFLAPDLLAGLTVAAVAIPQAIAYASIAELPPHYGLYTAAIAAVVGSLWGFSRFLASGPVNATSLLVFPILLSVATPGSPDYLLAASLVAVIAGLLRVMLALLHFGAIVTLASRAVLIGFTAGAAIHIAVGQVKHLLGIDLTATPELHRTVSALLSRVGELSPPSLILGLATLAIVIVLKRFGPRVPAALIAIVGAAGAVVVFQLEAQGVRVVGAIPRSLPPPTWIALDRLPDLELVRGVIVGSMAVAALGLIEAVAASQTLARRSGDRLDSNQEFFGQGLANIASGLFSGYACSGSFTRSALAHQSGARTRMTGVITGVAVLAGMLLFAPWARLIPRAAIAGVLLVVAWRMIDREGIRRVLSTSKSETAVMTVTFGATLVLPLDFAVLAGVVFSLAFFVVKSSLPRVVPVVPDPTFRHLVPDPTRPVCPQLGVLNIRGPLFFGAVYHIEEELKHNHQRHPGQNFLMLRLHGVDICDLTGIEMLESIVKTYRQLGGDVFLVRPRQPVLNVMEHSGFLDQTLGRDHILRQEGAIEQIFDQVLDPVVCIYECEHRVFAECHALEKHRYDLKLPPAQRLPHLQDRFVSPDRLQELASDPATVIYDIREVDEYVRGHVPGAVSLPLRVLPERWPELPRDRTVLLVCRSGRRSTRALHMLEDAGLDNVNALRGGILAWRAEGLPVTPAEETMVATEGPVVQVVPAEPDRRRGVLAAMRLKRQTEELERELDLLGVTDNLPRLRETLERLLDLKSATSSREGGVVMLDPTKPVLIVSDSHAQRNALGKLLGQTYIGESTNLASIVRGKLQVLLLGDVLHSESKSRWQAVSDEFVTQFASEGDEVGPTPSMDREMANSFGLAAMILTLQRSAPGVHLLKGNHDNLLNASTQGNGEIIKHASWPGEGEIARAWTVLRFGSSFAGKYANWENRLPIFAIYHDRDDGLKFVASHTEPNKAYTLEQIKQRTDEVVFGLTWTRNEGIFARDVLRDVFGRDWMRACYFVSHTGSDEGIIAVPRNNLVIVNKPRHLVAALVRPGVRDFEIHIVADG
jgi:SulP family sulfate permease